MTATASPHPSPTPPPSDQVRDTGLPQNTSPSAGGAWLSLTYNLCALHMLVPPLHPGKHCHLLTSAGHSPGSPGEPFHSHMWLFHTHTCLPCAPAYLLAPSQMAAPTLLSGCAPPPPAASLSPHFQGFSLAVSPPWHGNGDGKWGIRNLNAVCLACYVLLICPHESDGVFHSWVLIEA